MKPRAANAARGYSHDADETPCQLPGSPPPGTELQQPRLRAGVGFDLQRGVVQPRDPEPGRHPHDPAGSVGAALLTGRFVARGNPTRLQPSVRRG
jgi:hypothetical protein